LRARRKYKAEKKKKKRRITLANVLPRDGLIFFAGEGKRREKGKKKTKGRLNNCFHHALRLVEKKRGKGCAFERIATSS